MIDAVHVCVRMLLALGLDASDDARLSVCTSVFDAALHAGDDPAEVAAQAGIESRWSATAESGGCHGPLQIQAHLRGHFCAAMNQGPDCDLITAGLGGRIRWRAWAKRKRLRTIADVLCFYNIGIGYGGGECGYSRAVLALTRKAR